MKDNLTWEEAVLWLRNQPEQQELVRACYYDDPLIDAAKRFAAGEEWQAVSKLLPAEGGRALDLGAGRGISSYALAKSNWSVDALEPDSSAVIGRGAIELLARQTGFRISALDGYAERIPVPDSEYDLVHGRQVMHHAHDLRKMCSEIYRVLKPRGMLISTREHVISRNEDLPIFLDNHPLHHLYGGENAYLLDEYLGAMEKAGLQVTQIIGPMASVINYFPASQEDWLTAIQAPLTRRLGYRTTRILLLNWLPWTSWVTRYLAGRADSKDQTPGRLYSFVATKKSA